MERTPPAPAGKFEHFLMLAQAAAAGAGIALIPKFLIGPELEAGALTSPLPIALTNEEAYYLVFPNNRRPTTALEQLRQWLFDERGVAQDA
jgi:DNA-binding transcriptional LysR family regulator